MGFVYLGLAIVLELLGTTFLKYTLGFTKLSPSLVVVAAYTGAFYFLSRSLQFIDLNIAYATWAGIGVVAAAIISMLVFHESINAIGAVGMTLVVSGVVLLNLHTELNSRQRKPLPVNRQGFILFRKACQRRAHFFKSAFSSLLFRFLFRPAFA